MIPIAKPFLGEEEASAARDAIFSGWITQGPRVKEFEEAFAGYTGSAYACAVSSCTAALHLALLVVGVKPGDLVLTVSHSFIATANAIRHCGAEPVFVDIDPVTFNMSPVSVNRFIAEECEIRNGGLYYGKLSEVMRGESPLSYNKSADGKISAILAVHQMGMPCDLTTILPVAEKFELPVVEDAACAIGSELSFGNGGAWEKIGRPHGDIACFSFHPRKVITTGDGGMITMNNPDYDKRIRLLRQHGMSVPDSVRHSSAKVVFEEYVVTGYNYRMTDVQAAIGIEQLKKLPQIVEGRRKIADLYREHLGNVQFLRLSEDPAFARTNWQSYPVRVLEGSAISRNELMQYLLDNGVASRPGIMNAHEERPYRTSLFDLAESERARKEVILLPNFHGLQEDEVSRIAQLIKRKMAKQFEKGAYNHGSE